MQTIRSRVVAVIVASMFVAIATSLVVYRTLFGAARNASELADRADASAHAAYEMEINTIGMGIGVLKYLATRDPQYRSRVDDDEGDFYRHFAIYEQLATDPERRTIALETKRRYQEFSARGRGLMDSEDLLHRRLPPVVEFVSRAQTLTSAGLNERDPSEAQVIAKIRLVRGAAAQFGSALIPYVRNPAAANHDEMRRHVRAITQATSELQRLPVSSPIRSPIEQFAKQLEATEPHFRDLFDQKIRTQADLAKFLDLRTELDDILDDDIQLFASQALEDSRVVLDRTSRNTSLAVLALTVVDASLGAFVIAFVVRQIKGPIGRLTDETKKVRADDMRARIIWPSKDEFQPFVNAFNGMLDQLESTTVSKENLERAEADLRAVVNAIPDLICQVDSDGGFVILKTGRQFQRLQPLFDACPRVFDLLPPQQGSDLGECLAEVLKTGHVANCEISVPVGRNTRNYEIRMARVGAAKALAIVRDVTRRRRADARRAQMHLAVERAAREWRLTFDAMDAQVLILSQNGLIHRMNQTTLQDLGGSFQDWIGRSSELLRDRQPWSRVLKAVSAARGQPIFEEVTDRDTLRTWVFICRSTVLPEEQEQSTVVVVREITKLVELQTSLRRSDSMAAIGALVAGVAHEVRNPLFGISSILDAWTLKGKNADSEKYLSMLSYEVARMRTLMGDLLEYAKPCELIQESTSIRDVIAEAAHSCESAAGASEVEVSICVPDVHIVMDRQRLARVFVNLIENALQHSLPGSTVAVEGHEEHQGVTSWLHVSVRDRGPGFDQAHLTHVFQPFFTRRKGGTGLGLAIVQRVIDEHGGRVAAKNHPDGGGVVTLSLPLTNRPVASTRSLAAQA
jgi:signal transduction histidine kinase